MDYCPIKTNIFLAGLEKEICKAPLLRPSPQPFSWTNGGSCLCETVLFLSTFLEFLHQGTADFWNSFCYSSRTHSVSWPTVIKTEMADFFSSSINVQITLLNSGTETVISPDILQSTRSWCVLGLVHVTGCSSTLPEALQHPPCHQHFHFCKSQPLILFAANDTRLSQFCSGEKQLSQTALIFSMISFEFFFHIPRESWTNP